VEAHKCCKSSISITLSQQHWPPDYRQSCKT